MRAYIAIGAIGVIAVDESGKLVGNSAFPKDAALAADRLATGGNELKELVANLEKQKFEVITKEPNPASDYMRANMRKLALEWNLAKDDAELNVFLSAVGIAKAKIAISSVARRDRLIVQAVNAFSDLDRILNLMTERLREWYGLHYPEFSPADQTKFIDAIVRFGARENFENFKSSMGMQLTEADVAILQEYAKELRTIYKMRESLESYLATAVTTEIPNMTALLGPLLAARLLAQSGSLERLAKMPSSTIQLLGAERALFKYLKSKNKQASRPPKFGVIFSHPDIAGAPKEQQGKIARLLAAKLTVAVRCDFYTKEDRKKELLDDYRMKLEAIRKGKAVSE